jgi:hypothetical protein
LPEVVGKIVQEAYLFLTKGRLTHLIRINGYRIGCSCGYNGSRRLRKGQISKLGKSYSIRAADIS